MPKSLFIGLLLTVVTVSIHAWGTSLWLHRLRRRYTDDSLRDWKPVTTLCLTAAWLLSLQVVEVVVWACVYLLLPSLEEVSTFEQAVYFSTVTFSTLGYGDIVLSSSWRLLGAVQAMSGLLIFGWSTALFYAVFERVWLANLLDNSDENRGD